MSLCHITGEGITSCHACSLPAQSQSQSQNGESVLTTVSQVFFKSQPGDLIEIKRNGGSEWVMCSETLGFVFNVQPLGDCESGRGQGRISLNTLTEVVNRSLCPSRPSPLSNNVRINNKGDSGLLSKSREEAVQSAVASLDKIVDYGNDICNSEYYATMWKFGSGGSGSDEGNKVSHVVKNVEPLVTRSRAEYGAESRATDLKHTRI